MTVAGTVRCVWDQPFDAINQLRHLSGHRWVGYFGYDCAGFFEELPTRAADDTKLPLFALMAFDQPGRNPAPAVPAPAVATTETSLRSTFSRASYIDAVERVIEYILAGDAYQVNLAQRFTAPLTRHPFEIYRTLLERAPAAYGAYLDFGDFQVISNSPELFLRVDPPTRDGRRRVTTRPIKGTRPRSTGMERELRDSEKDRAELAMIVDVERNDLGRVCEIGSVKVVEPRTIEAHPTVFHGVATIEGILRRDVTFMDLLRATFPSGSVTGAPKIRAMEIIDELEPVRRGAYCGAIGYIDPDGAIELSVAIRTMVAKDGQIHIPVGGGIVADSDPAAEYEETLVKARAMFEAVGVTL